MVVASLITVVPGLMVWTVIAFGITFFVLRKFAFSRIQGIIDERRDRTPAELIDEFTDAVRRRAAQVDADPPRDPKAKPVATLKCSGSPCERPCPP